MVWRIRNSQFGLSHVLLLIGGCAICFSSWFQFRSSDVRMRSNRNLDLAVFGRGYFEIIDPAGRIRYTRIGKFEVDADGDISPRLDSLEGWCLASGIAVPQGCEEIRVASDGTVSARDIDGVGIALGNITLSRFENPSRLHEVMPGVYAATASSGEPIIGTPGQTGFGYLQPGWIEQDYSFSKSLGIARNFAVLIGLSYLVLAARSNARTIKEMRAQLNELTAQKSLRRCALNSEVPITAAETESVDAV